MQDAIGYSLEVIPVPASGAACLPGFPPDFGYGIDVDPVTPPPAAGFDWPFRWSVPSVSDPAEGDHVVDLGAYRGNGACSCKHFTMVLEPLLKLGDAPSDVTRCRHLVSARSALCDAVIRLALTECGVGAIDGT